MCAQRRLRSAWASAQSDQSSLCAQWVAKGPSFLHADSEDSDQTGRMPSLIWVVASAHSLCWFCHEAAQLSAYKASNFGGNDLWWALNAALQKSSAKRQGFILKLFPKYFPKLSYLCTRKMYVTRYLLYVYLWFVILLLSVCSCLFL